MSEQTKIEWTDHTANFWWGCEKVSQGCKNCYADTWAMRWDKQIWGSPKTTNREAKKGIWKDLPKWNKAAKRDNVRRRVFAMSMGDLFEDHPQVTEWRNEALQLMVTLENLDFQLLTKRPQFVNEMVYSALGTTLADFDNMWIGTSVENQKQADERIPHLVNIPSRLRFLSMEPLLGHVDLRQWLNYETGYDDIGLESAGFDPEFDWVIVGGESGNNARPMNPEWARFIRNQCVAADVPFFFKQWGEYSPFYKAVNEETKTIELRRVPSDGYVKIGKAKSGNILDGKVWQQTPF